MRGWQDEMNAEMPREHIAATQSVHVDYRSGIHPLGKADVMRFARGL